MLLSGGQEDVFLHAPLGPPAGQLQRVGGGLGQGALLQLKEESSFSSSDALDKFM